MRRHLPNALTIARFVAIPVFAWLYLAAGDGPAWGAGVFFAAAAATDQVDGFLARRWHVQSAFGKVADPLADRLMIGTAVVLLWATGRLPLVAALVVLGRDLALVLGYKLLAPEQRQGPQGFVKLDPGHARAAFFLRAAGSAFFAADFAAGLDLLPPASSMLRLSASMRLTTLAGFDGAFSFGAGKPACLERMSSIIAFS